MSRSWSLAARVMVVALTMTVLAACRDDHDGATPDSATPTAPLSLTSQQAERLAVARFNAYDDGVRAFEAALTDGVTSATASGWVDYREHVGYALVVSTPVAGSGTSPAPTPFLTTWNLAEVATQSTTAPTPPLPIARAGWQTLPLRPDSSFLASALLVLVNLGNDRPDNPQLLMQTGARWLRADSVNGTQVDVMSGPAASSPDDGGGSDEGTSSAPAEATVRYWVDDRGDLLRIELRLAPRAPWSVVDFSPATEVRLGGPMKRRS